MLFKCTDTEGGKTKTFPASLNKEEILTAEKGVDTRKMYLLSIQ